MLAEANKPPLPLSTPSDPTERITPLKDPVQRFLRHRKEAKPRYAEFRQLQPEPTRQASQRFAHGSYAQNRTSCILTRGPNRSKAAIVTGSSSELAQEPTRRAECGPCVETGGAGGWGNDGRHVSIHDNEKYNPLDFWECAGDGKEKIEGNYTKKHMSHIFDSSCQVSTQSRQDTALAPLRILWDIFAMRAR